MTFIQERPLVATIVYLGLLIYTIHSLEEHYKKLKDKEEFDWNVIMLIGLIILGVYGLVTYTEDVAKSSENTIKKISQNPEYIQEQLLQIKNLKTITNQIQQDIFS